MKTCYLLLLASGLSTAANAADTQDHFRVDLGLGVASQHGEGSSLATHVAVAWELRPQLSLELWYGRGRNSAHAGAPGRDDLYNFHGWIDRIHGIGIRYDFDRGADARWHPFFRTGWARVRATVEQAVSVSYVNYYEEELNVYRYYQTSIKDDAPYLAVGTRYDLSANWSLSAQVLHVPSDLGGLDMERTEGLIGLSYAF
jgi:hypothetical protein